MQWYLKTKLDVKVIILNINDNLNWSNVILIILSVSIFGYIFNSLGKEK